jgi:methyl-accepting chemotaxis protein
MKPPWPIISFWKHEKRQLSLSKKLLLLFLMISVTFLLIAGGSGSYYFKHHFKDHVLPHLFQYLEYVRNDIGVPADLQKAQVLADKLDIDIAIIDGRGVWTSDGGVLPWEQREEEESYTHRGVRYTEIDIGHKDYAGMHINDTTFLFNLGAIKSHKHPRALLPLLFLVLMAYVLYRVTRKLFAPILQIQISVKRIGLGELSHRVAINRHDELGVLADDINAMAAELQKMLDAKRQLLLAVSHELRSPLSRAKKWNI